MKNKKCKTRKAPILTDSQKSLISAIDHACKVLRKKYSKDRIEVPSNLSREEKREFMLKKR